MKGVLVLVAGVILTLNITLLAQTTETEFNCSYNLRFFDKAKDQNITITQYLITGPEEATVQKLYAQLREYPIRLLLPKRILTNWRINSARWINMR